MPWGKVTKEHVESAIARFLKERPEYSPARNTFLVYNRERLPAKHIRGMAYEECFGGSVSHDEYTGGKETLRFFVDRGYTVEYRGNIFQPAERTDVCSEGDGGKDVVAGASPREKIQIPVGGATEQKEDPTLKSQKERKSQKEHLFDLLNKIFAGNVVREKRFDWMRVPDRLDDMPVRLRSKKNSPKNPVLCYKDFTQRLNTKGKSGLCRILTHCSPKR